MIPLGINQHDAVIVTGKLETTLPQRAGDLQLITVCPLLPQQARMPALVAMGQGYTSIQLPVAEFRC